MPSSPSALRLEKETHESAGFNSYQRLSDELSVMSLSKSSTVQEMFIWSGNAQNR